MKLTKNQLLGSLATTAITSTAVLAVACGPTNYSNKVLLKTTWSSSGQQLKALETIVHEYNLQRKAGDFEVVIEQVPGGYGKITEKDSQDIKAQYMDQVADLFLDYPSEAAKIYGYGKKLDLSPAVPKEAFEEKFIKFNDDIQGAKKGEILNVPLAKATEMMTLNIPVISYIDSKLQKTSPISGATGILEKIRNYQIKASNSGTVESKEWEEIAKIWGDLKTPLNSTDKIDISNKTFESYQELFKWANKVGEAFIHYIADRSIIGHDAPTTLTYLYANEKLGGKSNNFLFHKKETNNNEVDYPVVDKTTDQAKALKSIFNEYKGLAEHNGMIFRGGGSYTSNSLKSHKTAISIGSTAGYSYNFATGAPTGYDNSSISRIYTITPNIDHKKYPNAIGLIKKGAWVNKVYPSTFKGSISSHDKKLADLTSDNALNKLLKSNKKAYLASFKQLPNSFANTKPAFTYQKFNTNYFLLTDSSKIEFGGGASTLQENEAVSTMVPSKFDATSKIEAFITQGPGIIGVKHGGNKDKSSLAFVKWLFDKDSKMINKAKEEGQTTIPTPIELFDKMSNYFTPIKDAFKGKNIYTKGNQVTFDTFKKVTENPNVNAFEDPASSISSSIRKDSFDGNLKQFNNFADDTKISTTSPDGIYGLIVDSINSFKVD